MDTRSNTFPSREKALVTAERARALQEKEHGKENVKYAVVDAKKYISIIHPDRISGIVKVKYCWR